MPEPGEVILVVDDNDGNRYTLGRYLKRHGFTVWEAASGRDALEQVKGKPALITLDVQLPDITGFDLCQKLKANPATASIPILQTSATFIDRSDKIQGLQGGADAYLVQPVDPDELLATVRSLLRVRQAEATAQKLADFWQATFDSINDGICVLNARGVVERANQAYADMLGLPLPDLLSRSMEDNFRGSPHAAGAVSRIEAVRQCGSGEFTLDGNRYRASITPASGPGQGEGFVCVFSDITSIWLADQKLRTLNEDLESRVRQRTADLQDANRQLESFCYSVSHDLRAPVRAMNAFSALLIEEEGGKIGAEGRSLLDRIHRAARRMELLIEDLLNYSRVTLSEIKLEPINLHELVLEVVKSHRSEVLPERPFEIAITVPDDVQVHAHRATLFQAVWNLVSNAIKFGEPGRECRIEISSARVEGRLRLYVKDNGIGISHQHRDRIFRMFEKLHVETAGTGIGLAIVRRSVERMGGKVGFDSEPGEGSSFWIEFPPTSPGNAGG
jgi:PAS domain S-box-containing protein